MTIQDKCKDCGKPLGEIKWDILDLKKLMRSDVMIVL